MNVLKYNIYLKMTVIVLIAFMLLIPTAMIKNLINEREQTQKEAISEVSSKWGEKQTISGPFISIPYYRTTKIVASDGVTENTTRVLDYIHIMPDQLNIYGQVFPEERNRGIYQIVVYRSDIRISGSFNEFNIGDLGIDPEDIVFDKAEFVVGISDLKGIDKVVELDWNGELILFNPGVSSNDVVDSAINADLSLNIIEESSYTFNINLSLKGSQLLYFTPVGKVNNIKVDSEWQNPSFMGAFLPDSRVVTDDRFEAKWSVLHLNRNYPQIWTGGRYRINQSSFGVDLLLPVDSYQKSFRSIKYAILFIGFTFLTFFFIEVLNRVFIHPVQYILVGFALVVFFTLLLSISEHLGFNPAFIISAVATLLLVAGYIKAILKSTQLTGLITGILFLLYAFIFITIQLQDYALMIGSIGIFIILGTVMYFSRKIDWFNLNLEENSEQVGQIQI